MPAESPEAVGFKLLSLAPANPAAGLARIQGLYILFDATTLTPQLLIDGTAVTSLRTPAVSALAARYLARPDASRLTIFGSGPQALGHVHALSAVRPISTVRVVARRPDRVAELCAALHEDGLDAAPGTADAVENADIVVCATTSTVPVFDGNRLAEQACVIAIGSHEPTIRELDDRVFTRASRVVVEDRTTALREAGDVVMAVRAGVLSTDRLVSLVEMLSLPAPSGISVFKSVGMGWQDLVIAQAAHAAWAATVPA